MFIRIALYCIIISAVRYFTGCLQFNIIELFMLEDAPCVEDVYLLTGTFVAVELAVLSYSGQARINRWKEYLMKSKSGKATVHLLRGTVLMLAAYTLIK